jgi:hypothetical protein
MQPYDPKILKQKAIEAIDKNKLIFIEDICAFIGICKATFYTYFPDKSDDLNYLREKLDKNKLDLKVGIRKKWFERQSDTGLMALYKLCSTPEEHRLLQQSYVEAKNENTDKIIIDWSEDNPNPNDNQTTEIN